MAQKPTIYRFDIALSDLERHCYEQLSLTVALHPSETLERMAVRVLAYCLNAAPGLAFGRGLSEADEPDLWLKSADGEIVRWIEVGEPSADRLRKAARRAREVRVYSFNSKSDTWWAQVAPRLEGLEVSVLQFAWPAVRQLASLIGRSTAASMTVSVDSAYFAAVGGECELAWRILRMP